MTWLGVIGNISLDTTSYPDGSTHRQLGGAALHVALAAASAADRGAVAPIAVVGDDLAWIRTDDRLAALDVASLSVTAGRSCAFNLRYDDTAQLTGIDCDYGVSTGLTRHALSVIGQHDQYHVCCRHPLDAPAVLERLAGWCFSVDFYVSSASAFVVNAAPLLTGASLIFVNAAEAELLADVVDIARLPAVVVSDGSRTARMLRHGRVVAQAEPAAVEALEVTGAGDTLAGTFLAHRANGCDDQQALRYAVAAATDAVQHMGLPLVT
jgi:sugar/nucleoside kinase (ribokinase family)